MVWPHAFLYHTKGLPNPITPQPLHGKAFCKRFNCVNNIPFVEMAVTPPKPWQNLNVIVVVF